MSFAIESIFLVFLPARFDVVLAEGNGARIDISIDYRLLIIRPGRMVEKFAADW